MITRATVISASLALGATAAIVPAFGGPAAAGPPSNTLDPNGPVTSPPMAPTTLPPTTVPIAEQDGPSSLVDFTPDGVVPTSGPPPSTDVSATGASAGPVFFDDLAPDRTPVSITPTANNVRSESTKRSTTSTQADGEIADDLRVDPVGESESVAKLEIDTGLLPEPTYLAPCGVVPFNLDPQGPMLLADMTGDGSADDRLSIRQVGSGTEVEYRLHLELNDGTRSETHISSFDGYLPVVSDRIKLWQESTMDHPSPDADEVLVTFGEVGTTRYWQLFGTDDRGCIAGYTNQIGSPATVMYRNDASYRAGWHCISSGHIKVDDATSNGDGTWDLRQHALRRTGPTSIDSAWLYGAYSVPTSAVPTYGAGC